MTPKTKQNHIEEIKAMARESFRDHRILEDEPWGWRIGRQGSSVHMAYVIVTGRFITVQGDLDIVSFAYAPGGGKADVLCWIADSSIDYARGKAAIGRRSIAKSRGSRYTRDA